MSHSINNSAFTGSRKKIEQIQSVKYPDVWEKETLERWRQFNDWRYMAMQIIQRNKGSFRVLAVLNVLFDIDAGESWATDESIAVEAGRCSTKTVSREINMLRKAGLIRCDPGWTEKSGKKVKGRRIRLSLPFDMGEIDIR